MRNNNLKGLFAQAVDDDGGGLLAGCGEFCSLGKGTGGGKLNSGEGGTCIRNALVLANSLEAAEPRPKSEVLLPSNFGRKSLKSVIAVKSVKDFRSKSQYNWCQRRTARPRCGVFNKCMLTRA
jgi:hypothetical protein